MERQRRNPGATIGFSELAKDKIPADFKAQYHLTRIFEAGCPKPHVLGSGSEAKGRALLILSSHYLSIGTT
jgi:hypothetical protein